MKYFFILGKNPTLSLAELNQVYNLENKRIVFFSAQVLIVEFDEKIQCDEEIKRLGGVIKIGEISGSVKNVNTQEIVRAIKPILKPQPGKFKFGFSYYGNRELNLKTVGMETKKYLKEQDVSCRWVVSRERTLSSVVVEQNKMIGNGAEIVLINVGSEILLGRTEAVQLFKDLSTRDYGRPERDDQSGMLPPKLAMIMINFARGGHELQKAKLLDPFCGSGTVLQEALVMGCKNLNGVDVSEKAVLDSKKNLAWIANKLKIDKFKLEVTQLSATELGKKFLASSIDYIVTEPYLGPQRGQIDFIKIIKELNQLYSEAIKQFLKVMKKEGRVVMIWPNFQEHNRERNTITTHTLNPRIEGFEIVKVLPKDFTREVIIKTTVRDTIVYGREGQRVWREIVVLEKK